MPMGIRVCLECMHYLSVLDGSEDSMQHGGTVPEAAIFFFLFFAFSRLSRKAHPSACARAKGVACETRRYSGVYFTKWWCPPHMDVQLDENFNSMALSIHLL